MKKKIFTIGLIISGMSLNAQVSDSVALGAGYMNESYYSLADGEVANVNNNDWDLAFDVSNFGAAIRANRLTEVYLYPGSTGDFETLDSTGITTWSRMYNRDYSWSIGALNTAADPDDAVDLGWGEYNTTTHYTEGSRLFVVKLQSGDYRKLFVEELGAGAYTFKHNNLENTDLVEEIITKADHNDKNFIHYSLETASVISREPSANEWDIVFTNYHSEVAPDAFYGVTGVLANKTVESQQVDEIATDEATFTTPFDSETNIIGYDWKSFNFGTYAYDITDSLTYFVTSTEGNVWKLIFTGFGGSSDGKFYFTKELVSTLSFENDQVATVSTYPNPTVDILNIASEKNLTNVNIYSLNGQMVLSNALVGGNFNTIDVSMLEKGTYVLEIIDQDGSVTINKIVVTD